VSKDILHVSSWHNLNSNFKVSYLVKLMNLLSFVVHLLSHAHCIVFLVILMITENMLVFFCTQVLCEYFSFELTLIHQVVS
jgi:hypothetical protein